FVHNRLEIKNFYRIENTKEVSHEDYLEVLANGRWVEFIFKEPHPFGIIAYKFQDLSKNMKNEYFNRMIVNIDSKKEIYFYNTESRNYYTTTILDDKNVDVGPFLNLSNLQYTKVHPNQLTNDILYLSEEEQDIPNKSYIIDQLSDSKYINS